MEATCRWNEDEEGNWATACENEHVFIDDGPWENGYRWCPYCGLMLTMFYFEAEVPDDEEPRAGVEDEGPGKAQ